MQNNQPNNPFVFDTGFTSNLDAVAAPQQFPARGRGGRGRGGHKGRGAQARRADTFNAKVNKATEDVRKETVAQKLKLSAPAFNFLRPPKSDCMTVSIWFYYLVSYFIDNIWPAMVDKGGRPFLTWCNEAPGLTTKRRRLFKFFLRVLEAKMWAAIRTPGDKPRDLLMSDRYSDETIQLLQSGLGKVPKPIAVLINNVGKFESNGQNWLPQRPVFKTAQALVTQSVFHLMTMIPSYMTAGNLAGLLITAIDPAARATAHLEKVEELFGVTWNVQNLLDQADIDKLVSRPVGPVFNQLLSTWNTAMSIQAERRGWCVSVDISHGDGDASQLVTNTGNDMFDIYDDSLFFAQSDVSESQYGYGISSGFGCTNCTYIVPDRHIGLGVRYALSHLNDVPARLRVAITSSQTDETLT